MTVIDGHGIPLGITTESASRNEIILSEPLLQQILLPIERVKRLIYDKAADGDGLRHRLLARGIDLIAPHKKNRVRKKLQDGRKLRHYRRRWKVERSFAWLHNFRRVVTRWEYHAHLYHGFVQLACLSTILHKS